MTSDNPDFRARRVITGVDDNGRSVVISDEFTPAHAKGEAFVNNQIWLLDSLSPTVLAVDASGGELISGFPTTGFVYFVTTFPPGADSGMHQTDTFDILTVVSGQLYCAMEDGEVQLNAGDSIVQRGTSHAWNNRSDEPCTVVTLMVGAAR